MEITIEDQLKHWETQIPILKVRLEYEKLLLDITETQLKRQNAINEFTQNHAPTVTTDGNED